MAISRLKMHLVSLGIVALFLCQITTCFSGIAKNQNNFATFENSGNVSGQFDASSSQYTGIGQSLNLLHNASRNDSNVPFTWSNGSSASYNIPLGNSWVGDTLGANITSLTDERNWVNGSFDYGLSDGNYNF
ncbi:MAG TPA: hypothetical protein VKK79_16880, partial [Candidatus Lokiarchaeia archaeon]|nr:hypothetical protein [Candidatus Lokiarchaeia archaeon]